MCIPDVGCVCGPSATGAACSPTQPASTADPWTRTSAGPPGVQATASHSAVVDEPAGMLWVFGGFDLNMASGALWRFNLRENTWVDETRTAAAAGAVPAARYSHAAALSDHFLWVVGGVVPTLDANFASRNEPYGAPDGAAYNPAAADPTLLANDVWRLNTVTLRWVRMSAMEGSLPPLAGHTLTPIGADTFLLIGGQSRPAIYNDVVYELNTVSLAVTRVVPGGAPVAQVRDEGESAKRESNERKEGHMGNGGEISPFACIRLLRDGSFLLLIA